MRVLVAPDGFGGTLTAAQAATAIAAGWRQARPGDVVTLTPLSDGGEGLLDVVTAEGDRTLVAEVSGPLGHPVDAPFVLRSDGTAVLETARACGLALVPEEQRSPLRATTFGVGQLVDAARAAGATRLLVGLGGSATVDGGAGALTGLGYRLRVADGSGLKVGGDDLHRIDRIERGWAEPTDDLEVELLADVTTPLVRAAEVFGPQKGASPQDVEQLTAALVRFADVVERDLLDGRHVRDTAGSGAAGGLAFALAAAFDAPIVSGVARVADLLDLDARLDDAELVVTGEGRLDATSTEGKVVAWVAEAARARGIPVVAVAGQVRPGGPELDDVEAASPDGPEADPAHDVVAAAARLAARQRA